MSKNVNKAIELSPRGHLHRLQSLAHFGAEPLMVKGSLTDQKRDACLKREKDRCKLARSSELNTYPRDSVDDSFDLKPETRALDTSLVGHPAPGILLDACTVRYIVRTQVYENAEIAGEVWGYAVKLIDLHQKLAALELDPHPAPLAREQARVDLLNLRMSQAHPGGCGSYVHTDDSYGKIGRKLYAITPVDDNSNPPKSVAEQLKEAKAALAEAQGKVAVSTKDVKIFPGSTDSTAHFNQTAGLAAMARRTGRPF